MSIVKINMYMKMLTQIIYSVIKYYISPSLQVKVYVVQDSLNLCYTKY